MNSSWPVRGTRGSPGAPAVSGAFPREARIPRSSGRPLESRQAVRIGRLLEVAPERRPGPAVEPGEAGGEGPGTLVAPDDLDDHQVRAGAVLVDHDGPGPARGGDLPGVGLELLGADAGPGQDQGLLAGGGRGDPEHQRDAARAGVHGVSRQTRRSRWRETTHQKCATARFRPERVTTGAVTALPSRANGSHRPSWATPAKVSTS